MPMYYDHNHRQISTQANLFHQIFVKVRLWSIQKSLTLYHYIKTNDTAKQLPDKCIKALDRFADKYIDEPEKDK